ncbi:MAG TPA: TadE/TadG family type IV pilus assembly protein [Clostridia bacterium]|nr:TadE/TadG family type IV pilus assembly protein [Clostridia bacterium]
MCKDKGERGQGIVEFAIILPILLLLLLVPIDLYRVINAKMILKSAASESISKINYEDVGIGGLEDAILDIVDECFGDKFDMDEVEISFLKEGPLVDKDYIYYVYSSDLADQNPGNFQKQFDKRSSSYKYREVELQMSYNIRPITIFGNMFIGNSFDVKTPVYKRDIYISGYERP